MDDLCTCGHARDEHAPTGGVCLAVEYGNGGRKWTCHCDRYDPEQDDL